jgi:hypothetical protein
LRPASGSPPFERATSMYSRCHRVSATLGGCQAMAE